MAPTTLDKVPAPQFLCGSDDILGLLCHAPTPQVPPNMLGSALYYGSVLAVPSPSNTLSSPLCQDKPHFLPS